MLDSDCLNEIDEKNKEITKGKFNKWIKSKERKIEKCLLKAILNNESCCYLPFIGNKKIFLNHSIKFFEENGYRVHTYVGRFTGSRYFRVSW
jgi:hypothetical protein